MRRTVLIAVTALVCLAASGVADAATATNNYTASFKTSGGKAGSAGKPLAVASMTESLSATPSAAGQVRAAPLIDIDTSIAGLKANITKFPTCTLKQIEATANSGWNVTSTCPTGSLVAKGSVMAQLGQSDLTQAGTNCSLQLNVYNGGHGNLAYFFIVPSPASCGGLTTGAALPYGGTVKQSGKAVVNNVPLPVDASTNAGNPSAAAHSIGLFASLEKEHLVWKSTYRVKGQLQPLFYSVGCQAGKRTSTTKFTSTQSGDPTDPAGSQSLAGSTVATVKSTTSC